jgi:anthranilate synthase component 2
MKVALVDNFDSFVHNLAQLIREQPAARCDVIRTDSIVPDALDAYDKILFSPGPGLPAPGNAMSRIIGRYGGRKPIFGVCLGHQAIGRHFGARLTRLPTVRHGLAREVSVTTDDDLFAGIGPRFSAGLYHSWQIDPATLPGCLTVTARGSDGSIMAIAHADHDIRGVQFHPESIMTGVGARLLANWLMSDRRRS